MIHRIRKHGYQGKIIGKCERWIGDWQRNIKELHDYIQQLQLCDALICNDNDKELYFYQSITSRPVYCIKNSYRSFVYNKIATKQSDPKVIGLGVGGIGISRNVIQNLIVFKQLLKRNNIISGKMLGVQKIQLTKGFVNQLGLDKFVTLQPWNSRIEFLKKLSNVGIMLHMNHNITTGRVQMDCANLKIPIVCPNTTDVWKECYSKFYNIDPFDYKRAILVCERIIKDNSYRQEIVNTAYEQIKKFEYKHFKKRLGDIIRREGYKVIGN